MTRAKGARLERDTVVELAADAGVVDDGGRFGGVVLAHNVRSPAEVDDVVGPLVGDGCRGDAFVQAHPESVELVTHERRQLGLKGREDVGRELDHVDVEFTFSPPWSPDMMADYVREELRAMGMLDMATYTQLQAADAMREAADQAEREMGITLRGIVTCIRHFGPEKARAPSGMKRSAGASTASSRAVTSRSGSRKK